MISILSVTPVAVRPPPGSGRSMKRSSLDLLGLMDATVYAVGAWPNSPHEVSRQTGQQIRAISNNDEPPNPGVHGAE